MIEGAQGRRGARSGAAPRKRPAQADASWLSTWLSGAGGPLPTPSRNTDSQGAVAPATASHDFFLTPQARELRRHDDARQALRSDMDSRNREFSALLGPRQPAAGNGTGGSTFFDRRIRGAGATRSAEMYDLTCDAEAEALAAPFPSATMTHVGWAVGVAGVGRPASPDWAAWAGERPGETLMFGRPMRRSGDASGPRPRPAPPPRLGGSQALWASEYGRLLAHEGATRVREWLEEWFSHSLGPTRKRRRLREDDEDCGSVDGLEPRRHLLLVGPPSSGKTSAVHAAAAALGLSVLELNASARRAARDLSCLHKELAPAASSGSASAPTETSGPAGRLILLEDVDIVAEADRGFWGSVLELLQQSRRPIVLTCTTNPLCASNRSLPLDLALGAVPVRVLHCARPSTEAVAHRLGAILAEAGLQVSPDVDVRIRRLAVAHRHDVRQLLHTLQWHLGGVSEGVASDSDFNRAKGPGDELAEAAEVAWTAADSDPNSVNSLGRWSDVLELQSSVWAAPYVTDDHPVAVLADEPDDDGSSGSALIGFPYLSKALLELSVGDRGQCRAAVPHCLSESDIIVESCPKLDSVDETRGSVSASARLETTRQYRVDFGALALAAFRPDSVGPCSAVWSSAEESTRAANAWELYQSNCVLGQPSWQARSAREHAFRCELWPMVTRLAAAHAIASNHSEPCLEMLSLGSSRPLTRRQRGALAPGRQWLPQMGISARAALLQLRRLSSRPIFPRETDTSVLEVVSAGDDARF